MPLVGEVDKIRQTLKPDPWNRLTLLPICQEGVGVWSLRVEVTMTTQAQLHGRNPGRGGLLRSAMAIDARDVELTRVEFMTEGKGLAILSYKVSTTRGIERAKADGDASGHRHHDHADPEGLLNNNLAESSVTPLEVDCDGWLIAICRSEAASPGHAYTSRHPRRPPPPLGES